MCIIAVSPLGEKFSQEVFVNMWESNSDGFGMAWRAAPSGVYVKKGLMDFEAAWAAYNAMPEGVPHVLHFRLATHGGVIPELTHPFLVSKSSDLFLEGVAHDPVLFHNGVWSAYTRAMPFPKGPLSDTRALAVYLARLRGGGSLEEMLRKGKEAMLEAGRVVIFPPEGDTLYLYGYWVKEGSFYFSNHSYKSYGRYVWKGVKGCSTC